MTSGACNAAPASGAKRVGIEAHGPLVPPPQEGGLVEPPEPLDFAGERRVGAGAIASAGINDDLSGIETVVGDQEIDADVIEVAGDGRGDSI